jgi:GNAT superfamily N-acetyltransferase
MSDDAGIPPDLVFRAGALDDWPVVAEIVAETWPGGDYIDQGLWAKWAADSDAHLVVGTQDGQMVGFARLSELGEAEWLLEGLRVAPERRGQGIGRALMAHMVELFRQHGMGLLRFVASSESEMMHRLAGDLGFRHTGSYAIVELSPRPADYRSFKVLQPQNLEMVKRYLINSPMHRVNRFALRRWVPYFLTEERLHDYLADEQVQVVGWRQFDKLHGLAILFIEPPDEHSSNPLRLGYLDALDDTTLHSMVLALCGLAAKRGHDKLAWMMPLGVGLERPLAGSGVERVRDFDLWLFELPLRS